MLIRPMLMGLPAAGAGGIPATWDPIRSASTLTYSSDNLTAFGNGNAGTVFATKLLSGGDYYFELANAGSSQRFFGFCNEAHQAAQTIGGNQNSIAFVPSLGAVRFNGSTVKTIQTVDAGIWIGLRYNTNTGLFSIYANGSLIGTATNLSSAKVYPAATISNGQNVTANFGGAAFNSGLPSGALSVNAAP